MSKTITLKRKLKCLRLDTINFNISVEVAEIGKLSLNVSSQCGFNCKKSFAHLSHNLSFIGSVVKCLLTVFPALSNSPF